MLVRVADIDVDLYFANAEQLGEASRWLWVVLGDADRELPLSADDAARIEDLLQDYAAQRRTANLQAQRARTAGAATFTLEIELPDRARTDVPQVIELLDRVNRMVTQEGFVMPASPEIRAFRRRLLGEIAAQVTAEP